MSKKMRKIAVVGMILTTLVGSIVGCSSSSKTETSSSTTTTTTESSNKTEEKKEEAQEPEVAKPEKIKFATNVGVKEEDGAPQWAAEFKNKTGIELEVQNIGGSEYYQKLELAFASGDTPDVFLVGDGKLNIYASQGALVDMTDLAGQSEVFQNMDQELLDTLRVDGKLYGVPLEQGGGPVTYMRQDWLDQLGLAAPTNYDEFIEVLRGFKSIDPKVIPFTAPGLVGNQAELYLREFYQDASPEFVQIDGQWVDGMTQANMVDALTRMRDAYAEGLIDVEVVTNKTSTCRDKWYAGDVGTFTYWAGNWYASLENRVQESIPTAKVTAMPAIDETHYIKRVPAAVSISKLSKNAEGVFKYFVEYMHDGAEGSTLFQHGVEGLHYELNGTEMLHLPKLSKPEELNEKAYITPALTVSPVNGIVYEVDPRITSSLGVLDQYGEQAIAVPMSKTLSKISSDLIALREKTVSSIVLGQTSLEEGLAKYEAEAKNLGIDQVIAELNQ